MTLMRFNNQNFPSLFDNLLSRDWMDWTNSNFSDTNTTMPAVNVKENNDEYVIEVAAPGMKKDDFTVEIDNDVLTISSEMQSEKEESNDNYTRKEFSFTSFKRAFTLPETVDGSKIDAKYEDGILRLTLPKKQEALPKPKRLIEIG